MLWPFAEGRVEQGRTSFVLLVGPYPPADKMHCSDLGTGEAWCLVSCVSVLLIPSLGSVRVRPCSVSPLVQTRTLKHREPE